MQRDGQHDPLLDVTEARCSECGQPVTSDEPYAVVGEDVFHARCFGLRGTSDDM